MQVDTSIRQVGIRPLMVVGSFAVGGSSTFFFPLSLDLTDANLNDTLSEL